MDVRHAATIALTNFNHTPILIFKLAKEINDNPNQNQNNILNLLLEKKTTPIDKDGISLLGQLLRNPNSNPTTRSLISDFLEANAKTNPEALKELWKSSKLNPKQSLAPTSNRDAIATMQSILTDIMPLGLAPDWAYDELKERLFLIEDMARTNHIELNFSNIIDYLFSLSRTHPEQIPFAKGEDELYLLDGSTLKNLRKEIFLRTLTPEGQAQWLSQNALKNLDSSEGINTSLQNQIPLLEFVQKYFGKAPNFAEISSITEHDKKQNNASNPETPQNTPSSASIDSK